VDGEGRWRWMKEGPIETMGMRCLSSGIEDLGLWRSRCFLAQLAARQSSSGCETRGVGMHCWKREQPTRYCEIDSSLPTVARTDVEMFKYRPCSELPPAQGTADTLSMYIYPTTSFSYKGPQTFCVHCPSAVQRCPELTTSRQHNYIQPHRSPPMRVVH